MRNPFKKQHTIKIKTPRFCERGHDLTDARMLYFYFPDTHTKWLCPYCFVEFLNGNISGIKEE